MIQENKELLIKDLCARLPYGVKCKVWYNDKTLDIKSTGIDFYTNTVNLDIPGDDNAKVYVDNIKPYLFPLSSMTEEQKKESPFESSLLNAFINGYISLFEDEELAIGDVVRMLEWLNKNHFDYRGLIPMDLAIDCTNLNIY